ncbi:MAG: hypothetical protein U0894_11065 [Pirellulales bacterium]
MPHAKCDAGTDKDRQEIKGASRDARAKRVWLVQVLQDVRRRVIGKLRYSWDELR